MERVYHRYSAELKQRLVEEIEQGQLSVREAARDAQTSVTMVQKWLEEYGRFTPKRDVVEVVMKSEQDKIAALEKALAEAHLKLRVYDELIHHANQRYKTDIKKNCGMPPLARAPTTTSRPSAARLSARATRTTSAAPAAAPRPARRPIGRDRLFALLRTTGRLVQRKPRYTRTTYSQHGYAVAPNRLKTTMVTAPRQVVVRDIPYLRLTHTFV